MLRRVPWQRAFRVFCVNLPHCLMRNAVVNCCQVPLDKAKGSLLTALLTPHLTVPVTNMGNPHCAPRQKKLAPAICYGIQNPLHTALKRVLRPRFASAQCGGRGQRPKKKRPQYSSQALCQ